MLLSIVMIIKDEEDVLERSLLALVPLMKEIESELVILDTGSTDNSVEIAKKYTDKVYFKEWNKNFADMRNESIKYAKGEWILILDADEELIYYSRLVEFFNNNIYKKYNSASIELKNIFSEDGKKFSIGTLPRLFRQAIDFRYEGAIHEQPIYKAPMFMNVATFNHYGYFFTNEELRQRKSKRNKEILFKALENNKDPYIYYQLGKDFDVCGEQSEALYYLEESKKIYSRNQKVPVFVYQNIARLYLSKNMYIKCINLCLEYIEKDNKNIDMYFYLATSQMGIGEYKKSIDNYKRYIYLLNNYKITTQANNISCEAETISALDICEENIVKGYFNIEKYREVIEYSLKLSNKSISNLYYVIFMSLCKENKLHKIKDIYIEYGKTNVEKEKIINKIELLIANIKIIEKQKVYKILSEIDDDYGKLNKLRLGEKINDNEIENILRSNSNGCYGDILYYNMDKFPNIAEVLKDITIINIEKFISYIVSNRKECILDLYKYIINTELSFDLKELKLLSIISKYLLYNSGLVGDKYKNIFNLYINYNYEYLRRLHSDQIGDEELAKLVKDKESIFVLEFVSIQKLKNIKPLDYIRSMKKLLINNQEYKKCIEIFIRKFEREISEKEELKELKIKYKSIIEENINNNNLEVSKKLVKDFEKEFDYEDISNIKAIVAICENNLEEAERNLKIAYCNNRYDEDVLFNIAYIKEAKGELLEAIEFYNRLLNISYSEEIAKKVKQLESFIYEEQKKLDINCLEIKKNIEELINENNLDEAKELLNEYKAMSKDDVSIYSIEGIILLNQGEINLACESFLKGLEIDSKDIDLLYNTAYACMLLGLNSEAIYYYTQCFNLTEDIDLKNDISNAVEQLEILENLNKKQTTITIGLEDNDQLFNYIEDDIIKVKINEEIKDSKKYADKDIEVYETKLNRLREVVQEIIRNNDNCTVIFNNYEINSLLNFEGNYKTIYYTNKNLATDKTNEINKNVNVFLEKEVCDKVNFTFTNNIEVYYFKNVIEKRENVYLINECSYEEIKRIINYAIDKEIINEKLINNANDIDDEYEKSLYLLSIEKDDLNKCLDISKYVYDKYNTEQSYQIYISLLSQSNNYDELLTTILNSRFCDDIYKSEILYLYSKGEKHLIKFIVSISIRNYKDLDFREFIDYKMAILLYELNRFDKSYNKYIKVINDGEMIDSPIVNRNIAFLMYKKRNPQYKEFYSKYKKLIDVINKEKNKQYK